jgi:DNA-directed RNA polymerase subunit beta'
MKSDEQTGHREKVVIETKDKTKIPSIIVEGKEKKAI